MTFSSYPLQKTPSPLQPSETHYREGCFTGTYIDGNRSYGTSGPVYESMAPAGRHALPLSKRISALVGRQAGSDCVWHVRAGKGTKVENIGFRVQTYFNADHEPIVSVHPYVIDTKKQLQGLENPNIAKTVCDICSEIARNGLTYTIDARKIVVAPRKISGEYAVLDSHGRKPIEWVRPGDQRARLEDFRFRFP